MKKNKHNRSKINTFGQSEHRCQRTIRWKSQPDRTKMSTQNIVGFVPEVILKGKTQGVVFFQITKQFLHDENYTKCRITFAFFRLKELHRLHLIPNGMGKGPHRLIGNLEKTGSFTAKNCSFWQISIQMRPNKLRRTDSNQKNSTTHSSYHDKQMVQLTGVFRKV